MVKNINSAYRSEGIMKRIKLIHGSARVEDNCSNEIIKALNELSKLAYQIHSKPKPIKVCENSCDWPNCTLEGCVGN